MGQDGILVYDCTLSDREDALVKPRPTQSNSKTLLWNFFHWQAQILNAVEAQPDSRSIALPGSQLAAAIWKRSCNGESLPKPALLVGAIQEARGALHEHQGFKCHPHGPFIRPWARISSSAVQKLADNNIHFIIIFAFGWAHNAKSRATAA